MDVEMTRATTKAQWNSSLTEEEEETSPLHPFNFASPPETATLKENDQMIFEYKPMSACTSPWFSGLFYELPLQSAPSLPPNMPFKRKKTE